MPRIARIVVVGYPHHIVQRGNNRGKVFFSRKDYEKYLSLLEKYSEDKKNSILAYCLMPNHVHMLIRPLEEESLSKMMQGVTLCYTQYFNREKARTGRLWESRYYSTVIDEERHLWAVSKYIESNPVRVGISKRPEDYLYSSARAHLLGKQDQLLKEDLFDKRELREYREFMKVEDAKKFQEEIRRQTRSGKPFGDLDFLETLSGKLGYLLCFRPKGRPKKDEK